MGVSLQVLFYGLIAFVLPSREVAKNAPASVGAVSAVFVDQGAHKPVVLVNIKAVEKAKGEFAVVIGSETYLGWHAKHKTITFETTAGDVSVVAGSGEYSILSFLADVQKASGVDTMAANFDAGKGGVEIKSGRLVCSQPDRILWKYEYLKPNDSIDAGDVANHMQQLSRDVIWTVTASSISVGSSKIKLQTGGDVIITNLPTELPESSKNELTHYRHVYEEVLDVHYPGPKKMYVPVNDGTMVTPTPSPTASTSDTKPPHVGLRPDTCPPPIAYRKPGT
jgi:hypothetical protein